MASLRALHPCFPRLYLTTTPSRWLHCSCRARAALRNSTTLGPGQDQWLCVLQRSSTPLTLQAAATHMGCSPTEMDAPGRDTAKPPCSGALSTLCQSFSTGRDMGS